MHPFFQHHVNAYPIIFEFFDSTRINLDLKPKISKYQKNYWCKSFWNFDTQLPSLLSETKSMLISLLQQSEYMFSNSLVIFDQLFESSLNESVNRSTGSLVSSGRFLICSSTCSLSWIDISSKSFILYRN